jgi:hypothetical protein
MSIEIDQTFSKPVRLFDKRGGKAVSILVGLRIFAA